MFRCRRRVKDERKKLSLLRMKPNESRKSFGIDYEPVKLFFTIHEPKDGSDSMKCPIIFVHGFFSTHRTWNFVNYKIANKTKRKVYSLDLRDYGQSEYSGFFTIRHIMADIESFMKSQQIQKAIFVAHSIGGKPLMALALEKPDLVEKLIVEDMAITNTVEFQKLVKHLSHFTTECDTYIRNAAFNTSQNDVRKRISGLIKQFFPQVNDTSTNNILNLPLKRDQSGKITWDLNIDAFIHYCNNTHLMEIDLSEDSKYLGNSLFLFGEKSPIKLEKDITLKHFPNAQFYLFKGGFHTFHLEFSELFTQLVSKFIEE